MRPSLRLIGICAATVLAIGGIQAADEPAGGWLTDLAAAQAAAKSGNKPILMDFTGSDWCGWCIKLKKEVFDTAEFTTWAAKNVVLLEVDFPNSKEQTDAVKAQNQELQGKYQVQGYPTIVLVAPDGNELGRMGYQRGGPKPWIAEAEKTIAK